MIGCIGLRGKKLSEMTLLFILIRRLPGLAFLVFIPRATVDVLNKEIEASKTALTSERKDR